MVNIEWDPSVKGKCIDALPMYFALGGTSLAWDVLIIIMPFPILRRLQLDMRSKVSQKCSIVSIATTVLTEMTRLL
jgi:hypothetical protein